MSVDLRANAIITFVTNGLGNVAGAAGALSRIGGTAGGAVSRGLDRARAATARLSSASFQAAAGIGAVIYRTQEFEKKALGARIATVADSMTRVGGRILVDHEKIAREGDKIKEQALVISKSFGIAPVGLMEAAEAAAKMGISLEKAESIMRTSALMNMADPEQGLGQAAEFLGTLSKQFNAPEASKDFGAWILATGDKIATVASGTRTSISNIEEGFRQFSGVFATFGATVEQSASLIGAMSQGGLLDVESGTALKSAALRFIKPTIEGLSAMSAAGFDRRNYMDLTGADPRRGTNQLMQLFGAYLGRDDKHALLGMLGQAQKAGKGADPAFIDKVASYIQQRTGGKENYEDTYLKVLNTITTSGGAVKIFDFLGDVAKAVKDNKLSDAQLASIFEGRHIARMKTLFAQWGEVERLMSLVNGLGGEGLDATKVEYLKSSFGKWNSALASLDRSLIRIRESDAFSGVVDTFERFSGAIASMPAGQAEMLGALAVGIAAIAGSPLAIAVAATYGIAKAMGYQQDHLGKLERMSDEELRGEIAKYPGNRGAGSDYAKELRKRQIARGEVEATWLEKQLGIGNEYISKDIMTRSGGWFGLPAAMPAAKPFQDVSRFPPNLYDGDGNWQPPPGFPAGRSAAQQPALVRDIVPTAGPQTIDITGRVLSDVTVQGQADVNVNNEITVRVEGPGTVTDKTSRTGTARVPLNTGRSMADTKAP